MARKVVLLDDVSGETIDDNLGGGTIKFSVEDTHYTIDLGIKNRDAFFKDLKKWTDAATEVEPEPQSAPRRGRPAGSGQAQASRTSTGSGYSKETLAQIREWAVANGHAVSPRGRIAAPILQAWEDAHKGSATNAPNPSKADAKKEEPAASA